MTKILALILYKWHSLGKSPLLSEPQFPYLQNGNVIAKQITKQVKDLLSTMPLEKQPLLFPLEDPSTRKQGWDDAKGPIPILTSI